MKKLTRRGKLLLSSSLLLSSVLTLALVTGTLASGNDSKESGEVASEYVNGWKYYNHEVQNDGDSRNDYNFGPDRRAQGEAAVSSGQASSLQSYIAAADQTGDFWTSLQNDPALRAATALHLDETLTGFSDKILKDEQNVPIGQRADAAHKHFLEDSAYANDCYETIKQRLGDANISLAVIDTYTSSMYMRPNVIDGNKPSVVVRKTSHAGGTFVQFDCGSHGTVKFRLECGYQAVDVKYWPTPENHPPVEDNPPDKTPKPVPEPEPEPTPDPTPEPKDPNAGPNGQINDPEAKADFGGGANQSNDTTVTPEPVSPSSYQSPAAPTGGSSSGGSSGGSGSSGNNEQAATDASRQNTVQTPAGQSGSPTVETDNGKTGTSNGQDYTVQAGDGKARQDLDQAQQNHSSQTVAEPVRNDGTNTGDVGAVD